MYQIQAQENLKIQTHICNNWYAEDEENLYSHLEALKTFILKSCMHVHV